jgi:hypothetical protein
MGDLHTAKEFRDEQYEKIGKILNAQGCDAAALGTKGPSFLYDHCAGVRENSRGHPGKGKAQQIQQQK